MNKFLFSVDDAAHAWQEWQFNCGPAALCAITNKTPAEIRQHLGDFESKGYTNPMLMASILNGLGIPFERVFQCTGPTRVPWSDQNLPEFGLMRVQWGGPWTNEGVPMRARYRHTHWVAIDRAHPTRVFDVNAVCVGGWIPWSEWVTQLVPWLLKEVAPKANGEWWPTHCWQVPRPLCDSIHRKWECRK
jgi:hypothetical protein